MKIILIICGLSVAAPALACTVKNQAALLVQFSSCASRSLPEGCITPADIQDLICSIPILAALTPPTMASTGFTSLTTNPGSYTLADSAAGVTISGPDQASDKINSACKTAPTPPYTITAKIAVSVNTGWGVGLLPDSGGGLAWRDTGTGKFITYWVLMSPTAPVNVGVPYVYSIDFSSTYVASGGEGNALIGTPFTWLRISDNGTTITESLANDGTNFVTVTSFAKAGSYLGTTGFNQVCFFASGHGSAVAVSMPSYAQTSP